MSWIAIAFAHHCERYVGLDISELVVVLMRTLVPERTVFYLLENLYDKRVVRRESGADTFFTGYVFAHLGWDEAVPMVEMARDLIRPGGVFIATFYKELGPEFPRHDAPAPTPGDSNLVAYSEEDITRLLDLGQFDLTERKDFTNKGNAAVNILATRRPYRGLRGLVSRFGR